jgi:hypothetical protein
VPEDQTLERYGDQSNRVCKPSLPRQVVALRLKEMACKGAREALKTPVQLFENVRHEILSREQGITVPEMCPVPYR